MRSKAILKWFGIASALLLLLLVGLFLFLEKAFPPKIESFKKNRERYQSVVNLIREGKLKIRTDKYGDFVPLPVEYGDLTVFGVALVKRKGELQIQFLLSKKKNDVEKFIYIAGSNPPLYKTKEGLVAPPHWLCEHWYYVNTMECYMTERAGRNRRNS